LNVEIGDRAVWIVRHSKRAEVLARLNKRARALRITPEEFHRVYRPNSFSQPTEPNDVYDVILNNPRATFDKLVSAYEYGKYCLQALYVQIVDGVEQPPSYVTRALGPRLAGQSAHPYFVRGRNAAEGELYVCRRLLEITAEDVTLGRPPEGDVLALLFRNVVVQINRVQLGQLMLYPDMATTFGKDYVAEEMGPAPAGINPFDHPENPYVQEALELIGQREPWRNGLTLDLALAPRGGVALMGE
jgi:hypothetical protein